MMAYIFVGTRRIHTILCTSWVIWFCGVLASSLTVSLLSSKPHLFRGELSVGGKRWLVHGVCMPGWVDWTHPVYAPRITLPFQVPSLASSTPNHPPISLCLHVCTFFLFTLRFVHFVSSCMPSIHPGLPVFCLCCIPLFQDALGGILKPTVASSPNQGLHSISQLPSKLVSDDLDSSLANLVGSTWWQYFIHIRWP